MTESSPDLENAFRALVSRYAPGLLRVCRHYEAGGEKRFARRIRLRNAAELAASVLLIALSLAMLVTRRDPLMIAIALSMIGGALCVLVTILRSGRNLVAPSPTAPVLEHLRHEHRQLSRQAALLARVRAWYLLPLAVPIVIAYGGFLWRVLARGSLEMGAALGVGARFVATVALFVTVDWVNRRAARRMRAQADTLARELDSFVTPE